MAVDLREGTLLQGKPVVAVDLKETSLLQEALPTLLQEETLRSLWCQWLSGLKDYYRRQALIVIGGTRGHSADVLVRHFHH